MKGYLDNSATTKPYPQVINKMVEVMEKGYGNPSSLHRLGLNSEKIIKEARAQVAKVLNVERDRIIFTSGGTESDNLAILGAARWKKQRGNKIITSEVEHPAVLEAMKILEEEGFYVVKIGVDEHCHLNMEQLKEEIDDNTILISIMHVNNEIGSIFPIEEIGSLKGNAIFHVDGIQSFGKIPIDTANIDLFSFSSHKIHGPKGIGGLYIGPKMENIKPVLVGGGQEKKLRSGTENVEAIAGFGVAVQITLEKEEEKRKKMKALQKVMRGMFEEELEDVGINTQGQYIPEILNVSFQKTRGEVLLHQLEQKGIFVSTGAACGNNKRGISHVLKAMGLSEKWAEGTLRFSFAYDTEEEDVVFAAKEVISAVKSFRALGSFR